MKKIALLGLITMCALAADVNVKLKITGMMCPSCAKNVKAAASSVNGVKDVKVYLKDERADVVCDSSVKPQSIADAIKKEGYGAEIIK